MSNQPSRQPMRIVHPDASVVHVERALVARADELEKLVREEMSSGADGANMARVTAADFVAAEFRRLAEELHWW